MAENLGIKYLHHIGFTVKDIKATQEFYEKLGFEFYDHWVETPEECALGMGFPGCAIEPVQMVGYGCMLEFIQYNEGKGSDTCVAANQIGAAHIALIVEDIYKFTDTLKAQGVEFVSPVIEHEFAPWVQLIDPDGIRVEFMQLREKE
ncbi:VOC family protein [Clostridium sp. Marseille-P3244]|uniref:VOC family protein n=1 Tax=Clostridium sp. Marseille-P3244 TaxID=1871020 RepID=UPI000930F874|nr:VOC family protein [Clostridium sp. Marseille-P3244]